MSGFSPHSGNARPCWECQHFGGSQAEDTAHCRHPVYAHTRAQMRLGCVSWTSSTRKPMRVLVCGGRDYLDRHAVFVSLDRLMAKRQVTTLIHGAAPGADSLAAEWAKLRGIEEIACPAEWKTHGRRAGPLRNAHMLTLNPEGLVAFPGGIGTADMVRQAEKAGLSVWRPLG